MSKSALLASVSGLAAFSASAADLGGNCCADLEERVAELEATAARKGNRKVSLQIGGKVSEAIVYWNDGRERNIYIGEDYATKNTIQFVGSAKINSDWSAGFRFELGIRAYRSSNIDQTSLGENNGVTITTYNTQSVALRQANWYLESRTYGRITVGRTNDSASGIASVNLANPGAFGDSGLDYGFINNNFTYRVRSSPFVGSIPKGNNGLSALRYGDVGHLRNGDGPSGLAYSETGSQIKYTSPFFLGRSKSSGFNVEASWGQDDFWSAALRYVEDYGTFRVAGAAAYSDWRGTDRGMCSNPTTNGGQVGTVNAAITGGAAGTVTNVNCNSIQFGGSVMHVPTGLYVSGGYGKIHDGMRRVAANVQGGVPAAVLAGISVRSEDSVWWTQAGWEAKLNTLGATTFWGMYTTYNIGLGVRNNQVQTVAATDLINSFGATALLYGAKSQIWGAGVTQSIEAASMLLYLGAFNESTEITLMRQSNGLTQKSNPVADFQTIYTGATIRF